jgi:hypothetical protein
LLEGNLRSLILKGCFQLRYLRPRLQCLFLPEYLNLLLILVNEGLDLLGMDGLKVKHLLFDPLVCLRSNPVRPDLPLQLQAHLSLSPHLPHAFLALLLHGGHLCLQSLVSRLKLAGMVRELLRVQGSLLQ